MKNDDIINKILQVIPDKQEWAATTSHKFKKDVWKFCSQSEIFKELIAVELGTSNGHSTNILSYLFDKVITVNNNESIRAKEFNSERDNITFFNFDLYCESWQFKKGDVFFIDADHSYSAVCMDIENCLQLKSSLEKKILIFDDYGINKYVNSVKKAIDVYIDNEVMEVLSYVGHARGFQFDDSYDRTLSHYEGVICQEM